MALSDFRNTDKWRWAIELAQDIAGLAEQLPAQEELGLGMELRKTMVKLPAAIAVETSPGDTMHRHLYIARIAAALDIVDKVYPALDTGEARTKLEKLMGEAPKAVDAPKPPAPHRPPSSVPVVPEDEPEAKHDSSADHHDHDEPAAPALKVAVSPDVPGAPAPRADHQEDHVHPDSVQ